MCGTGRRRMGEALVVQQAQPLRAGRLLREMYPLLVPTSWPATGLGRAPAGEERKH